MDAERAREFLRRLPFVQETMQWGENLVFWVGDKAVGGKMFAIINLDADGRAVIGFAAGANRFHELLEIEGLFPAPYLARAHWVSMQSWDSIPGKDLEQLLSTAHQLIYQKLPQRTKNVLAIPAREFQKLRTAREKLPVEQVQPKAGARGKRTTVSKAATRAASRGAKQAAKKASRSPRTG